MALHYQNKLSITFYITGPLGNIAATYGSRGNSRANSRTGSKENLCEDCVQNPLDLVDASIQVEIFILENFFLFCLTSICSTACVFLESSSCMFYPHQAMSMSDVATFSSVSSLYF